jgi:N-acetylglucosaminyldiphosphoundecaprenol N-acetyl-beta-D-mannosaminyltransferase
MQLFGISISENSHDAIMTQVKKFLKESRFHRIATVNPEFLVLAERNREFKQALLSADICVADGIGIVWAGWFRGKHIVRFPGADLLHEVLVIAEQERHGVFLAIKNDGLSSYEEVREALLRLFPQLIVNGENLDSNQSLHSTFNIQHSNIILCNFGAPEQELFLESLRNNPGNVRLAIGVGGALDYLTGKQKRAPRCLRAIGLEWLWRLILQPQRFKRIWNAVVVFPVKVVMWKIHR